MMRRLGAIAGSGFVFFARLLRSIVGVPDYDRYVSHMARRHPQRPVLSMREFHDQRLSARYERPGSRCC